MYEVLKYTGDGNENLKICNEITVNHYPDRNKSRGSYLSLLELSVKEDPNDDRNMHYLGREYMYYGMWNKAIDTLIRYLSLESATIVETSTINSVLTVRNPAGNATALTITPLAGGTSPVSAHLSILQIS